jgi:hypothetical protein
MDFGPHADDVMDFADFVLSGGIFRDPRPPLGPELVIIRSMADANKYTHASPGVPVGKRYDWGELLRFAGEPDSKMERKRLDYFRAHPGLMDHLREFVDGPINEYLRRQLGSNYTEIDTIYVLGTVDQILRSRATHGRTLPFIERLVEIYRLGGHPCGWIGAYPEGRLVAYFPEGTVRGQRPMTRAEGDG